MSRPIVPPIRDLPVAQELEARGTEFVVPVLREDLDIRKEVFSTGTVRLRKVIHEAPETISELLTSESVDVERIPMDVLVEAPPPVRMEGDVTVISIVEEVVVVTKHLRLKEELRISKRQVVSESHQDVTLRSEELIVERVEHANPTQV